MDTLQAAIKQFDRFLTTGERHPDIVAAIQSGIISDKCMTVPSTCFPSGREVRKAINNQDFLGRQHFFWAVCQSN